MARVDGPDGPRLRFGVVQPEDAGRWKAANKGRTIQLDAAGAERLRQILTTAATDGKKNVADYRGQLRASRAAGLPKSEWPDSEADIASGVIEGAQWGDLRWKLTREQGSDYVAGGVNYGPGGEWNLAIDPMPDGTAETARDDFNATTAATVNKLNKAISNLIGTAGG